MRKFKLQHKDQHESIDLFRFTLRVKLQIEIKFQRLRYKVYGIYSIQLKDYKLYKFYLRCGVGGFCDTRRNLSTTFAQDWRGDWQFCCLMWLTLCDVPFCRVAGPALVSALLI